eukprot:6461873-Alexandrium_andersonii.AAC.1
MSASLVGSEMCIRDRRPTGWGRSTKRSEPRCRAQRAVRKPRKGQARDAPCLLYTSDAADDM